jgi:uncharacterized coiled-coil DUF342 family protein
MAQLKQVCTVTNGSQTVKVIGVNVAYRILANSMFLVSPDLVPYTVAADATFDGTNTVVTLTGAYQGATNAMAQGAFVTDMTYPDNLPLISQGDVGTAAIWTKAMYTLQSMLSNVSADGLNAFIAQINATQAAASASQTAAKTSETNAKTSETNAASSKTAAAASQTAAKTSETNSKTSETNSKTSETNAAASATASANSATAAAASKTAAATSETNASSSAAAALASKNAAGTSETNSAASAAAALASQNAAKTSETNSKTSETNAKTSETNAAASKTAAKTSETNAKTSETNAAASATSAAADRSTVQGILTTMNALYLGNKATAPTVDNSGNPLVLGAEYFDTTKQLLRVYTSTGWKDYDADAQTQAVNATASASAAAGSASGAATSAANAHTSELNAASSAAAALASQNAAKTSETNSKTSETNSKTSETNSKTSENNAKTSETNAAASAAHADAVAATIGNPVSKDGDTVNGDLWVGNALDVDTNQRTFGANYRIGIARSSATGFSPYMVITNTPLKVASPPAAQTDVGSINWRWGSTTSDVLAGATGADIHGYANTDGSMMLALFSRDSSAAIQSRFYLNKGRYLFGSANDDGVSAIQVNPSGATLAQAPVYNAPTMRIIDAGSATSGGLSIEAYQPLIQFIDRSTSARDGRMLYNDGSWQLSNDTTAALGTFGSYMVGIHGDGYMSLGGSLSANAMIYMRGTHVGTGTTNYGAQMNAEFNETSTGAAYAYSSVPKVKDAAFTLPNLIGFIAQNPTVGASATVTTYTGVHVSDSSAGATNIAYRGLMNSGTNKWNLYMSGSALNYLNGRTLYGGTTDDGSSQVQINNPATGHGLTIRRNASTTQYLALGSNTGLDTNAPADHKIVGYSPASAAKPIYIHATTDEAGTVPTNGTVGINFKVLNTTVVKVFQSGNVSINPAGGAVDDAANALQVGGNVKSIGTITAQPAGSSGAWMWADATKGYFQTYNDAMVGSTAGNLLFMANNAEKARITSAGRMLIGSATDNGTDTVQSVAPATGYAFAAQRSGSITSQYIGIGPAPSASKTANYIDSYSPASNAKALILNSTTDASNTAPTAGNVGVYLSIFGTQKLSVMQSGNVLVNTGTDNGTDAFQVSGSTKLGGALAVTGAASFSSTVTSPTPALYDNSTNSATTAFVLANAIPQRAPLGGSVDLNTITSTGTYHQPTNANASSGTNYPAASAGMLEVYSSSSMTYQRYTVYNTGVVYTRAIYNGTPSAWRMSIDSVGGGTISSTLGVTGLLTASGGISVTGASSFSVRPTFNGATPWDSGNLNFATPPAIGLTTPAAAKFTSLSTTAGMAAAGTIQCGPGVGAATSYITPAAIFATKTGNTSGTDFYTEMWNDGTTGGIWINSGSGYSKGLITATPGQIAAGTAQVLGRTATTLVAHWSGNTAAVGSATAIKCSAAWLSTGRVRVYLTEGFAFATHSLIVSGNAVSNGTNWCVASLLANDGGGGWVDIGLMQTGNGAGASVDGQIQLTVLRVN